MSKALVAYFSATGTTGMAATALADAAGADLIPRPSEERFSGGLSLCLKERR